MKKTYRDETIHKSERLAEIQKMIHSMHEQPRLSDSMPPDAKTVWAYGEEIAKLKIITPRNKQNHPNK